MLTGDAGSTEGKMKQDESYQVLEDDFKSTFIRELLPGVLHNFANPLNGIMGRSKLLQRRIDAVVKKISEQDPETRAGLKDDLQRIKNDIHSINRDAESFFHLFRDVSDKFSSLASRGNERINLSRLLAAEIRFADFYLEFKHKITKHCEFDDNLPEISGNAAELSLVFWELIRHAMSRALTDPENKTFLLRTASDAEKILVTIRYSGEAEESGENSNLLAGLQQGAFDSARLRLDCGVLSALDLLRKFPVSLKFSREENLNVLSLTFDYSGNND